MGQHNYLNLIFFIIFLLNVPVVQMQNADVFHLYETPKRIVLTFEEKTKSLQPAVIMFWI